MIDATGAIYVIGGTYPNYMDYNDVWASTDGGARPDSVGDGRGVSWGTQEVLGGTRGFYTGTTRELQGILKGYWRGTHGVLMGYSRGYSRGV